MNCNEQVNFVSVPIIPEFLYNINHPDAPLDSTAMTRTTTTKAPPPCQGMRSDLIDLNSTAIDVLGNITSMSWKRCVF